MIKSHIILPRLLLKKFETNNRFYYFDLDGNFIGENGSSRSFNRKVDYYSASAETFLNKEVEAKFSIFLQKIDSIISPSEDKYILDINDERIVKKFFSAVISRNPCQVNAINENSIFFQFLSDQEQHDYAAIEGINIATGNDIFIGYKLGFLSNCSRIPFVLPNCGIYSFSISVDGRYDCIGLPVSPTVLIMLKKRICKNCAGSDLVLFCSDDDNLIQHLNRDAVIRQIKINNGGQVICSQKEELIRLQNFVLSQ